MIKPTGYHRSLFLIAGLTKVGDDVKGERGGKSYRCGAAAIETDVGLDH
ncbi:hypothetical protein [Paenibacillus sp. EPM92]|nr:hypothetical protein [Paenibacillus sp. EPM92]